MDASAGNVNAKPGFVRADLLQPGDRLRTLTGTALVTLVQFSAQRETVYNFTVGEYHTYHVGANGVLVHNCGARELFEKATGLDLPISMEVHHRIPKMFRAARGGPIPDNEIDELYNLVAVDRGTHQQISDMWNAFARQNPGATAGQIRAFKYQVDLRFGGQYILP